MNDVVICAARRTPMGAFQGQFQHLTGPQLAAFVIRDIVATTRIQLVDECLLGMVLSAGVGQAPARQALRLAGLSDSIPCTTINKVCGSAMKAIATGWDAIHCGNANSILAGGMESMSRAPHLLDLRSNFKMGHQQLRDHMFVDGLENADDGKLMGHFADRCAELYGFDRQQQDCYARTSVERAQSAEQQGEFQRERIIVEDIQSDEPLLHCDISKIHRLKPAFNHIGGTVTAANASSIADGAALVLLCERDWAMQNGLTVIASIKAHASYAKAPEEFTTAVEGAVQGVLRRARWSISDVDVFEINEAFAVVVLAAMQSLQLQHDQVNLYGGACALGHPIGASGARILVTLLNVMGKHQFRKGIASVCIGGGEAMALAVEYEADGNINGCY